MAGVSFAGVELRKLPPSFRIKIGQLLDDGEVWKELMCSIPSETDPRVPKYSMGAVGLVERHGRMTGTPCGELLLDEWGCSGRVRPTVETLLGLLTQCRMYRAADYVATEILGEEEPRRPDAGPAARVPWEPRQATTSTLLVREERVEGLQEVLEKLVNYDHSSLQIPNAFQNLISFPLEVIKYGTRDMSEEVAIGQGAFGKVYRLDLRDAGGPLLATKVLLLNQNGSVVDVEEQFLTEIRVLSEYRHDNLLPLLGYCSSGLQHCLVYEFMERGSLLDALACTSTIHQQYQPLVWGERLDILLGVARGLQYLHTANAKPLIHRDIKSANVLLSDNLTPKIGDFGLAKSLQGTNSNQTSALVSTIHGTSAYMAPEAFRGDISAKMDIYSFGVIMLEVLTGLPPFDEEREEGNDIVTYVQEVVQEELDILNWMDPKGGDMDPQQGQEALAVYKLSSSCLEDKKTRRPTTAQVLSQLEALHFQKRRQ